MVCVGDVLVLLIVAVPAHANGLAMLNGSAVRVVASHLCSVHLAILTRADLLELTIRLHIV